jgi:hypothetical protein
MDHQAQLRELRLLLKDELDRHARAIEAIERRITILLGDAKPRTRVTQLVSPDGKVTPIKYRD